jgi:hypothetical protein
MSFAVIANIDPNTIAQNARIIITLFNGGLNKKKF